MKDLSRNLISVACLMLSAGTLVMAQPKIGVEAHESGAGFVRIFDGKSLNGWDGDPLYWSVKDGAILGKITPETILERNTFLIWREGTTGDFELKLEYRISEEGNSGICYRCIEVPGLPWALKGYQSDIDGKGQWNGQNYQERVRTFLGLRGQVTRISEGEDPVALGSLGDMDHLGELVKKDDWNQVHLIVRGNIMIHMINGHVMSLVVDDDPINRTMDGLLGFQVHVGPPMTVEYRNILIKRL